MFPISPDRHRVVFRVPHVRASLASLGCALLLGACASEGATRVASLIAVTPLDASPECAHGGTRIDVGLDDGLPGGAPANGTLEAEEIDGTTYACHGADGADGADGDEGTPGDDGERGHASLVAVRDADAEDCPHGGRAIDFGLDDGLPGGVADDGVLADEEIDATTNVCDGATGDDGHVALIATSDAGEGCPATGDRIDVGVDDGAPGGIADDGVLQAEEIDATTYACDGVAGEGCTLSSEGAAQVLSCPNGERVRWWPAGYLTMPLVDSGYFVICGVRPDGTLRCWGDNGYGQLNAPPGTFRAVSSGRYHACGLRPDGTVTCWGSNIDGESNAPTGTFASVSAGIDLTCGVRADHTVRCWGNDDRGQASPPPGAFRSVSAGRSHACGIRTDGTLSCWGGDNAAQVTPPPGTFLSVSADWYHTCAVRSDRAVLCWAAADGYGEISPPAGEFASVTTGHLASCGLRMDGSIVCWGLDNHGQRQAPAGRFVSVSGGEFHACGVRVDGETVCWGARTDVPADFPE